MVLLLAEIEGCALCVLFHREVHNSAHIGSHTSGVVWTTERAYEHGYMDHPEEWGNLGQGAPYVTFHPTFACIIPPPILMHCLLYVMGGISKFPLSTPT